MIVGKLAVGFIQNIPYFLTQIGTLLGQMISTIASNFPKLVSSGGSMLLKIIAGFINGITNIPSAVKKAVDSFKSNFRDVDWGELGTNIIKGIVNGITGGIGKLVTAAKNVAKNALDAAKEALGIHSPSRVFELEVGKMIDLGLAAGIERNLKPVQTSMKVLSMETVGSMDINTMFAGESTFYQNQSMELVDQNRSVIFNYERLADATVDAFERAGFTFRANNRELGRFVRGVNMA